MVTEAVNNRMKLFEIVEANPSARAWAEYLQKRKEVR